MENNQCIVCKFGGTSLATVESIKTVKQILKENPARKIVVVSAPGKRFKEDIKITDCLIKCFELSKKGKSFNTYFKKICTRFLDLCKDLGVNINLDRYFDALKCKIEKHDDYDYVLSRGEFFSGLILSKYFGYQFVDAEKVVKFFEDGRLNFKATNRAIATSYSKFGTMVVPGFYGSAGTKIKVFSRGGSDLSGAIIASAVSANLYENWTDVDGFLKADPRVCADAPTIPILTYSELRELSYMGATVLHPSCVFYLKDKKIPINLKNTFNKANAGSLIVYENNDVNQSITGIAGQKGFIIIKIKKYCLNESLGVISSIAEIFNTLKLSIEHIPTEIDSISVIIKNKLTLKEIDSLVQKIKKCMQPDEVTVIKDVALISVVGTSLKHNLDLERKVMNTIYNSGKQILTINKGAEGISTIFSVEQSNYNTIIEFLYKNLI